MRVEAREVLYGGLVALGNGARSASGFAEVDFRACSVHVTSAKIGHRDPFRADSGSGSGSPRRAGGLVFGGDALISPPRSPGRKSPKSASPKNKKQSSKLKADAAPFPVVEVRAPPLPPVTALSQVLAFDAAGGDDDDKPRAPQQLRRVVVGRRGDGVRRVVVRRVVVRRVVVRRAARRLAPGGVGRPAAPPLKENVDADDKDDKDEGRVGSGVAGEKAAHHAASEAEATAGLEREAEMAWREAETWVEHEEALELREEFLQSPRCGTGAGSAASSPRGSARPRRTRAASASPRSSPSPREAEARRHDRGGAHAAHLESVRKKAVRESNKVDEISFINEMGLLDMQFDLKRRLNEMEARIDEARARRARLLAGVSSKQQAREKDKEDKLASVGGVREGARPPPSTRGRPTTPSPATRRPASRSRTTSSRRAAASAAAPPRGRRWPGAAVGVCVGWALRRSLAPGRGAGRRSPAAVARTRAASRRSSRGDAALLSAVGAGDVVDALPDAVVHAAASAATLDLAAAALALVAALAAADVTRGAAAVVLRATRGRRRRRGARRDVPRAGPGPGARGPRRARRRDAGAPGAQRDRPTATLNEQVFSTTMRPQLLHLCDTLFQTLVDAAGDAPRRGAGDAPRRLAADDCLDELVELAATALVNQECLQWGSASRVTLLRRLLQLPFKYFSRPRHVDLAKRDDAPESVALRGRIPEPLWDRAAAYFDRLSNTATLD
ncbi:hypothetical protein JL720_10544 [Aureococcus anophagefferens]|nr:hypothetical protein JL720_10544 [Aureococcus anophagefferens]